MRIESGGNSNSNNMQTGDPKDFKVALVGGGMGALALAVGLIRGGVKVDIFEQAVIGSSNAPAEYINSPSN